MKICVSKTTGTALLLKSALLFAAILTCAPVQARNYIFFGQQPLTMVSDKGEFSSFELGRYDEARKRYVIDCCDPSRSQRRIAYPNGFNGFNGCNDFLR